MASISFDDLIKSLHKTEEAKLADTSMEDDKIITINDKRQFVLGSNFNSIIAYEGDINSQIVTIKCVKTYDSHNLSECAYKELKWKNMSSGREGVSKLLLTSHSPSDPDFFYLKWEVPSEACTHSGTLTISAQFYDKTEDNRYVAYSWNTADYSGLSIGRSLDSVNNALPPKDEILLLDGETKNILAPLGYNNVICNYGDVGLSKVYILVDRYIRKDKTFDINHDDVKITFYLKTIYGDGYTYRSNDINDGFTKRLYTAEILDRNNEGQVLIEWNVPSSLSCNKAAYCGNLTLIIKFELTINGKQKVWYSNAYSNLSIGFNPAAIVETPDGPISINTIYEAIEQYFDENDVIFDANDIISDENNDIFDENDIVFDSNT